MADAFETAKFYDCGEPEELSWDCPEDALEHFFDDAYEKGETFRAAIARLAPVEVAAYDRMEINDQQRRSWADDVVERLRDSMTDEFSDPSGDRDVFDVEDAEVKRLARELVERAGAISRVWACEEVARRSYSAADLEVMFASEIESEERGRG